mmetsp:Transcript_31089/g.47167  ORF Transcript_31089/g.47167 Transcript_31089/m.47167 type:complete len:83 (+) Transcript_31089:1343-1591(+)
MLWFVLSSAFEDAVGVISTKHMLSYHIYLLIIHLFLILSSYNLTLIESVLQFPSRQQAPVQESLLQQASPNGHSEAPSFALS